jgi:hypothetical protein
MASKSVRLPTLIEPSVMPRPVSNNGSSPAPDRGQASTNQADVSTHGQGLERHRDRPRSADLDDTVDAAAISQLAHLLVQIWRLGVVDHIRGPECLSRSAFSAVEVVAITRAPKSLAEPQANGCPRRRRC